MLLVSIVIFSVAAIFLLPTLSDLISLLALRRGTGPLAPSAQDTRFLILIPAHDEELLISHTVESTQALRWPPHLVRTIVIADNCTDATAEVARGAGAEVLERRHETLRGKPRAIAWALERVDLADYDAVVVLDADSLIDPGYCQAIASAAPVRSRAFQGWIDVSNRTETALTRMGAVFSTARCLYANELKTRTGLTVPFGNGLCLGAEVLERHGWTAFSICEDWELYAILTEQGVPVLGVPAAHTYSQEAKTLKQGSSQRSRWAAGKTTVLARYLGPLLRTRRIGWRQKLDAVAELTGLGPVVHAGVAALLSVLAAALAVPGWPWLVALLLGSLLRTVVLTALALRHDPEPGKAILAFLYLPWYAVWRIVVQVKSFGMLGDKPWVRTDRHAQQPADTPPLDRQGP